MIYFLLIVPSKLFTVLCIFDVTKKILALSLFYKS